MNQKSLMGDENNSEEESIEESDGKRYEMLWDCNRCGTKKLLGVTHRYCAGCGSPQKSEQRYFPEEDEKIAVEDSEYVGSDKNCPRCSAAMSAKVNNCTQCGSPMDGAKDIKIKEDSADLSATKKSEESINTSDSSKKNNFIKWALLGGGGAIIIFSLICVFWKKDVSVKVISQTWKRTINVERYGAVRETKWCDQMPDRAYKIKRSREKRSTKQVADGKKCRSVKKNLGDGSFKKIKKCKTKYREVAVYGYKCRYKIKRWKYKRKVVAQGSIEKTLSWPKVVLAKKGKCKGCERKGSKKAEYKVVFQGSEKKYNCTYSDQKKWKQYKIGQSYKSTVGVISGGLDCNINTRGTK